MKILITAPSLDEHRNVSGISTVVRQIIEYGTFDYTHFRAGRRDSERSGVGWFMKQMLLPASFALDIIRTRPDVVHINTALAGRSIWRDSILAAVARLARKYTVIGIHGGRFLTNEFESSRLERRARKMLFRADVVLVLSETEKNLLDSRWSTSNIQVLPNAIPFPDTPASSNVAAVPGIIFLGRMHESKGLSEIEEALRILKQESIAFSFTAFGEGPLRKQFVSEMTEMLGGDFRYGGIVSGADKWKALFLADIFVLPSKYGEGLPMAMLEAMAAECVVVASDIASTASVIDDGRNGYLVEPENVPELVKILKLILQNKPDWPPVQIAAAATIRDNFSIDEYIHRLEQIYSEVSA